METSSCWTVTRALLHSSCGVAPPFPRDSHLPTGLPLQGLSGDSQSGSPGCWEWPEVRGYEGQASWESGCFALGRTWDTSRIAKPRPPPPRRCSGWLSLPACSAPPGLDAEWWAHTPGTGFPLRLERGWRATCPARNVLITEQQGKMGAGRGGEGPKNKAFHRLDGARHPCGDPHARGGLRGGCLGVCAAEGGAGAGCLQNQVLPLCVPCIPCRMAALV